jgi:hypothetical protein
MDANWQTLVEDIMTGMRDWCTAHPKATFAEIEAAVDERLNVLRARILEQAALASAATTITAGERPACPTCGAQLEGRGQQERTLITQGDQEVHLRRSYTVCPVCGTGLFPPG